MSDAINLKIGMFGGGGCGKTNITLRFLKDEICEGYIPTIEDEFTKVIDVDNKKVNISIVDTAGYDDFAEMRYSYYKQSQAYVFVFDISNPQSIDEIKRMYYDAKEIKDDDDDMICVIAANNAHLRGEKRSDLVPIERYKELENEMKCRVYETSALTGKNINEIFQYLARRFINPKLQAKPRFTFSTKGSPTPPEPLNVEQTKRRSSLFSKRSDKRKSKEIQQNTAPVDNTSSTNKLIEDLKSLALAKATQLKNSIQTNTALQEKVENLENELKLKNNQIEEYLQKIKTLEKELEIKEAKAEEYKKKLMQTNLHILRHDDLINLNKLEVIGRGSVSVVEKVNIKQDLVLKSYYIDLFKNNDSDDDDSDDDDSDNNEKESINKGIMEEIKSQYEIVNDINSPYIAKASGIFFGDEMNPPAILLEYFPYNLKKDVKELTNIERISIIWEICQVMKEVHSSQIIHCDLTPGNILLDSDKHVKLSDFGFFALIKSDTPLLGRTQVFETQMFMAPELLLCESEYNEKVDVYSFGAIVYFILTKGKYLTAKNNGTDGISITPNSKINEFSCNLINKCCSKLANQRPSFEEIAEIINQNRFKLIDDVDTQSLQT